MKLFSAERERLVFLWPVGMMIGIAAYFAPPDEPAIYLSIGALALCTGLLLLTWRRPFRIYIMPFFLIALGFSASSFRAHLVSTPLITEELHYRMVEGDIDEVEPVEKRVKLVLSHVKIEGLPADATPLRVRLSFRDDGAVWQVGDRVRMQADIFPLPQPVMPDSYDFARHFYFRRIGGNGFAMRPPEVISSTGNSGIYNYFSNLRHRIGEDMRAKMPGETGAVAAAMTVGETGPIPTEAKDNLRNSGLAHMLAIAGLHLGIVAAIIFFNVRFLLALSTTLALRFPIKKIAACIALIGAGIYLFLAGAPVPALRAFIMVAVLFGGFMLDRSGISLRTLSLAAGFILLIFPESMFGASFQMSFAATLAIICFSESFAPYLYRRGNFGWRKIYNHGLSIIFTSLVATLATAPFVLYNFNRLASFGLISNIIVVPLATFIIMPGLVISLLLMPLGLQWLGYIPVKFGIDIMLRLAAWVVSLPYASLHLPAPSDAGLIISAAGLLWICLIRQRWRLFGIPVMIMGLATMLLHTPPDMLISHDMRQVMARLPDGRYTLLKGSAHSFTAQNWLRAEGQDEAVPLKDSAVECDREICDYQIGAHHILIIKTKWDGGRAGEVACASNADILVAWQYLHREDCLGPVQFIGRGELEAYGAHELWLKPGEIKITRVRQNPGQRLWQLPFGGMDDGYDEY